MKKITQAFTLIELLIVVAIIAILAAIAVPNFLEAQMRSKVSRAKADMRTLATAIEAYHVDANTYPPDGTDIAPFNPANFDVKTRLLLLTTPVSYLSTLPGDPFHLTPNRDTGLPAAYVQTDKALFQTPHPFTYVYNTFGSYNGLFDAGPNNGGNPHNYTFSSLGPDRTFDAALIGQRIEYDPSNGTISVGDINRSGGDRIPL